jgi:isoprenylcysteine carboxyl methyltransferase (ICMT) family protein YpbQ
LLQDSYREWAAPVLGYLLVRLAEYRTHHQNLSFLVSQGAREVLVQKNQIMRGLWFMVFPVALIEILLNVYGLGKIERSVSWLFIVFGLLIRRLAIAKMGAHWTQSTLVYFIEGNALQKRLFFYRRVEFLARLLDGSALFWLMGAPLSSLCYGVAFCILSSKVIPAESWRLANSVEQRN